MKHTPESLLALTKSPDGLEQLRIIAAEADGFNKCPCGKKFCVWRNDGDGSFITPNYPYSLDAIFAAEDRLRIHDVHSQLNSEWKKHLTHISEITGIGFLSFTPPLRLIPFILTAQWKEQNQ